MVGGPPHEWSRMVVFVSRRWLWSVGALALALGCQLALSRPDDAAVTGATDAGTPTDALGPTDDAGARGCARYPDAAFCVDFESAESLGPRTWTTTWVTDAAAIDLLDGGFESAHAAAFSIAGDASCANATLDRNIVKPFSRIVAKANLRLETPASSLIFHFTGADGTQVNVVSSLDSERRTFLVVQSIRSDGGSTTESSGADLVLTPLGTWVEAELSLDMRTTPATARFTLADVATEPVPLSDGFAAEKPVFTLGAWCVGRTVRFAVDDVRIVAD